jgi:hypothetical protein
MDADAACAAAAAVEEAIACAAESPLEPLLLLVPRVVGLPVVPAGGFQLRKEVQILQGLPSGPRTMPGGSGRAFDEDCAVEEASVLLESVLIVTPRQPRNEEREVRLYCAMYCGGRRVAAVVVADTRYAAPGRKSRNARDWSTHDKSNIQPGPYAHRPQSP